MNINIKDLFKKSNKLKNIDSIVNVYIIKYNFSTIRKIKKKV